MGKKSKNQKPLSPQDQHILLQRITELTKQTQLLKELIQKSSKKPYKPLISRILKWIWRFFEGLSILSSFLIPIGAFYLSLSNFISIPPTRSLKLTDPLTVPLVIQNNSFLDLKAINLEMTAVDVQGDTRHVKKVKIAKSTTSFRVIKTLRPNKSETILFKPNFLGKEEQFISISKADIQVSISYMILSLPKTYKESFRFIGIESESGLYQFYPVEEIEIKRPKVKRNSN